MATFWNASPEVQKIILDQGFLHVQARLSTSAAMQARLSQVCALLLAGAAVGAQLAYSIPKDSGLVPVCGLAGIAAAAFAAGGIATLTGLKTGDLYIPGADPVWWAGADDISKFDKVAAEHWAIGHMQDAIDSLDRQASRRARALNMGLVYGGVASGLMAFAALLALFRS